VLEFKTVHSGIDSLYLSFKGTLKKEMLKELEMRKEYAQSEDENEQALAVINIDAHLLEVKDRGMGLYVYVLGDIRYRFLQARAESLPFMSSLKANCLTASAYITQ